LAWIIDTDECTACGTCADERCKEKVQEVAEGQAYLDALNTYFGIKLDAPYEALRPLPKSDKGSSC